jgi:glucose-1-phosphate thymidylyltransferase
MRGLVLAGGHGTRLRPLTFTGNKHMLPIANQPILFYGLQHLARAGVRDVGIVLGPIQEGIREAVGDGSAFGFRVTYIHQGDPKGIAHAVVCARDFLGDEPFVMYLGDNLLQEGVGEFVRAYEASHPDAVVGAMPVAHPEQYGIVELADGNEIRSIEEKPSHPKSDLALIGVYLFAPTIHPVIAALRPSRRGELEITEAIWNLRQTGGRVLVRRVEGWWKDTGRPEDLLEANELVLGTLPPAAFTREGTVAPGARLQGSIGIGPGTVIEEGVSVTGPVVIGRGVQLRTGSVVGPGTAVGNEVTVEGASIRRSIVLENTRIHGPVRIADSLIGRNVEIRSEGTPEREISLMLGDAARLRF